MEMRSSTGSSTGTSGSTSISCQDCGNKAKRDCEHHRCRTCCKNRGLPCPTHVKSTWIPVSARRRRHHHHHLLLPPPPSATIDHHLHHHLPLSLSTSPTTLHHLRPGMEERNFPPEVNSLATFRCIKVSSQENVVDQYAYQTSINIGGHVFKGILYDQGPTIGGGGDTTSAATSDNHQQLHHQFEHIAVANTTTLHPPLSPQGGAANLFYPSSYSGSFNAFLPGMQFFPHPRP